MKLFVAGLPKDFDEIDLKEMFQLYGEVTDVKIVEDRATRQSKGFGFVTMPNKLEAMEAIALFGNTKIKGKQIIVKQAEEQRGPDFRNNTRRW